MSCQRENDINSLTLLSLARNPTAVNIVVSEATLTLRACAYARIRAQCECGFIAVSQRRRVEFSDVLRWFQFTMITSVAYSGKITEVVVTESFQFWL